MSSIAPADLLVVLVMVGVPVTLLLLFWGMGRDHRDR